MGAKVKLTAKNLLLSVVSIIFYCPAFGQTPSDHTEVWQNIQEYWDLWAQRELDGFMEYCHVAYSGWDYDDPMHKNKKTTQNWLKQDFKENSVLFFDISPIDIKIHNDTAISHYYFSVLEENTEGNRIKRRGRMTDVLLKQNNSWVLIARHGGYNP